MTSILTNSSALKILQSLSATAGRLGATERRVATGLRVGSASDNAALWSIAQGLSANSKYWSNIEDGIRFASSAVGMAQRSAERVVANLSDLKAAIVTFANSISDNHRRTILVQIENLIQSNDTIVRNSSTVSGSLLTETTPIGLQNDSGSEYKTPVDYVFCLDISGSMGSMLDATRNNLKAFADGRVAAGEDARFSFVTYSDVGPENGSEPLDNSEFYSNADEFKTRLDGISLLGGGDIPESGLEALQLVRLQNFRPNAARNVIMITDATVHHIGDGSGSVNSVAGTVADLAADRIKVTIAGPIPHDGPLKEISDGTGGSYHDVFDPDFFSEGFGVPPNPPIVGPVFRVLRSPEGETINIFHRSLLSTDLGLRELNLEEPEEALKAVDRAVKLALDHATYLGASYTRLMGAADLANRVQGAYRSSVSSITDADLEEESVKLSAIKAQYELSLQALSIVNSQPSILLSLFSQN